MGPRRVDEKLLPHDSHIPLLGEDTRDISDIPHGLCHTREGQTDRIGPVPRWLLSPGTLTYLSCAKALWPPDRKTEPGIWGWEGLLGAREPRERRPSSRACAPKA